MTTATIEHPLTARDSIELTDAGRRLFPRSQFRTGVVLRIVGRDDLVAVQWHSMKASAVLHSKFIRRMAA